eukprot:7534270-Pyramimonas_sp.AAC.1
MWDGSSTLQMRVGPGQAQSHVTVLNTWPSQQRWERETHRQECQACARQENLRSLAPVWAAPKKTGCQCSLRVSAIGPGSLTTSLWWP